MLIIVRVGLGHHTQDATEIAGSLTASATHQSIIPSARSSLQQQSSLPSWQVFDIKVEREENSRGPSLFEDLGRWHKSVKRKDDL
jgi:hypothetical protein